MSAASTSADLSLARAVALVNAGDTGGARVLCEQELQAHPRQPGLLQLLGHIYLQQDDPQRAAQCAYASLALRPDHGPTLLLAGDAARALGDLPAALKHHEHAWRRTPERADASTALGLSLRAAGRMAEAGQALAHAVTLDPARIDAWFALALVRQDLHDYAGAEKALRRLLKIAPPRAEVELNLGIVLQESGQFDEAMKAYGRAFRINPVTFGRIAHALATPNTGCLWLDLDDLRTALTVPLG